MDVNFHQSENERIGINGKVETEGSGRPYVVMNMAQIDRKGNLTFFLHDPKVLLDLRDVAGRLYAELSGKQAEYEKAEAEKDKESGL